LQSFTLNGLFTHLNRPLPSSSSLAAGAWRKTVSEALQSGLFRYSVFNRNDSQKGASVFRGWAVFAPLP
jgi:hypothetical protein